MQSATDETALPVKTVRVGYTRGDMLPTFGNLVEVECHALLRSGFAYWTITKPEHTGVLAVFGEGPNQLRVRARVVQCKVAEHNGRLRTLVTCQFIGRV